MASSSQAERRDEEQRQPALFAAGEPLAVNRPYRALVHTSSDARRMASWH